MPCHDPDFPPAEVKVQHLTKMLCATCKVAEAAGVRLPSEVITWWEAHKRVDEEERRRDLAEAERLLKKHGFNRTFYVF